LKPEEVEVNVVRAEVVEETGETGVEESELDAQVEFCRQKEQTEMAVACN